MGCFVPIASRSRLRVGPSLPLTPSARNMHSCRSLSLIPPPPPGRNTHHFETRTVAGAGNVLFFSLDEGFAGRVHPGGVERVDVLGATGGGGTVDEGQEISHDRTHRLVSVACRAPATLVFVVSDAERTGDFFADGRLLLSVRAVAVRCGVCVRCLVESSSVWFVYVYTYW